VLSGHDHAHGVAAVVPPIEVVRYRKDMATNLRLDGEAAAALRTAARASGRSQQDLLREAVDRFLGLGSTTSRDRAVASGLVRAPSAFVDVEPSVQLSPGTSSLDLLERDDR